MRKLPLCATLAILAAAAVGPFVLPGCCLSRNSLAVPGFVGVPESVERSEDIALPLTDDPASDDDAFDRLVRFLAADGNRRHAEREDFVTDFAIVRERFAPIFARLGSPVTSADLREGSALVKLFDEEQYILTVHDARVDRDELGAYYDLDSSRALGLIAKGFVFAFYRRRLASGPANEWVLEGSFEQEEDENPGVYHGLVVFKKTFALPERAQ